MNTRQELEGVPVHVDITTLKDLSEAYRQALIERQKVERHNRGSSKKKRIIMYCEVFRDR